MISSEKDPSFTISDCNISNNILKNNITVTPNAENKMYSLGGGIGTVAPVNSSYTLTPLTIENSSISNNEAKKSWGGGGISVDCDLTLTNTHVDGNTLGTDVTDSSLYGGGGIYTNSSSCNLTVNGGSVDRNVAKFAGGGIYARGPAVITGGSISSNTLQQFYRAFAGGIYALNITTIDGTKIDGNEITAPSSADGRALGGGIILNRAASVIKNSQVTNNIINAGGTADSDNHARGGGIFSGSGTMIQSCTVSGNKINCLDSYPTDSSEMFLGGGIYVISGTTQTTIDGCTITGNTSPYGGGVAYGGLQGQPALSVTNTTISGNTALEKGGGISLARTTIGGVLLLDGSVVESNTAKQFGAIYLNNEGTSNGHFLQLGGAVKIRYNRTSDGETSNLYIYPGRRVVVNSAFNENTQIYYTLSTRTGSVTTGYSTYNGDANPAQFFVPDDAMCVSRLENDEVYSIIDYQAIAESHGLGSSHTDGGLDFRPFSEFNANNILNNSSQFFYLTEDTTLVKPMAISAYNATVMLCLNGYKLTARNCSMFAVERTSALYILDCNGTRPHSYSKRADGSWNFNGTGNIHVGGILNMENTDGTSHNMIDLYNAKFYMYGGTITAYNPTYTINLSTAADGSTVYLKDTTIAGNYANYFIYARGSGSNICTKADITLTNVHMYDNTFGNFLYFFTSNRSTIKFEGCDIHDNKFAGVAFYAINADWDLYDNSITNNKLGGHLIAISYSSTVADSNTTLTMHSGEISNNSLYEENMNRAIVLIGNTCVFNMFGGKITDNSFLNKTGGGGGVFVATGGIFNIKGRPVISGNKVHVTANSPNGDEMNVCLQATAVDSNVKMNVVGAMEAGANVGVTIYGPNASGVNAPLKGFMSTGYGTYNGTTAPSEYFYSDTKKFDILLDEDSHELTTIVKKEITLDMQYNDSYVTEEGETVTYAVKGSAFTYENTKLARPDAPLRYGWTFIDWYTDRACTQLYDFDTIVTDDFTLYAKWERAHFTVTFDTNHGTSIAAQSVEYEAQATEPANPPRKSGYRFMGWYADAECTVEYDFSTPVTEAITIYAKWEREYSVVFNTNGGTAIVTQKVLDGGSITMPANPTRRNHIFKGWYLDNDTFTQDATAVLSSAVHDDVTVYAKWEYKCEHGSKEYTKAVAATCVTPGNLEYWYCPECAKYLDKNDATANEYEDNTKFLIAATGVHTVVEDAAIPATCERDGKTAGTHCAVCGEILSGQEVVPATGHTPGPKATCTTSQICTVCNKVLVTALGHKWSSAWTTDGTSHWHVCENDSTHKRATGSHTYKWIIDTPATYSAEGVKHQECTVCGYAKEPVAIDKLVCTHTEFEHHEKVEPACLTPGTIEYYYCPQCHEYFNSASFTTKIADDNMGETAVAEVLKIAALGHDYAHSRVEPTCEVDGAEVDTCRRCGDVQSEPITKLGHNLVSVAKQYPTCTEIGWEAYEYCTREGCGHTTYQEIPAKGHSWGEWDSNYDETCVAAGTKTRYCTVCGATETDVDESRPALGHYYEGAEFEVDVEPTCTSKGSKSKHCIRCGERSTTEVEEIDELPHSPGNNATCTKDQICRVCGTVITPALGHDFAAVWSYDGDTHWHECTRCNEHADEAAHSMIVIAVLEPTEAREGLGYEKCEFCDHRGADSVIIPKKDCAHADAEHRERLEATCTEDGYAEHWYCPTCKNFYLDGDFQKYVMPDKDAPEGAIPSSLVFTATGHNFATEWSGDGTNHWHACLNGCGEKQDDEAHSFEWIVDKAAEEITAGIRHEECSVCGYIRNENTIIEPTDSCKHIRLEYTAAKDSTCSTLGNPEYWYCASCNHYFKNVNCTEMYEGAEAPTLPLNKKGHVWATEWSQNSGNHWHVCTLCGVTNGKAAHKFTHVDKAATAVTAGASYDKCDVCGYVRNATYIPPTGSCKHTNLTHADMVASTCSVQGNPEYWYCEDCGRYFKDEHCVEVFDGTDKPTLPLDDTAHVWSTEWTSDSDGHWHKCTLCGADGEKVAHVCQHVVILPGEFTRGAVYDECTICHARVNAEYTDPTGKCKHLEPLDHVAYVAPTCEALGNPEYWFCSGCGKYFKDEHCMEMFEGEGEPTIDNADAHVWSTEWSSDGTHHWHVCTLCGAVDESSRAEHTFEWVVDRNSTEYLAGIRHEECSVCGAKRNEDSVLAPTECSHTDLMHYAATAATCVDKGTPEYWYCEECGHYFADKDCFAFIGDGVTEPSADVDLENGHEWSNAWTTDGEKHWHECNNGCGMKKDEGEHEYDSWTSDGEKHWHECTICGEKQDEAAHTFVWVIDKEATDTETGIKHEECTVCGEKRNENTEIPAGGETESDKFTLKEGITEHPYKFQYGDFTEETDVSTYVYNVDKQLYITRLALNDTLADLLAQFANGNITAWDKDGNQITDMNTVLATGMMLRIMDGETVLNQLTLSVLGDINGDGVIKANDKAQLNAYTGETLELKAEQLLAGDINGDKAIKANDKAQLNAYTGDTLDIYAGLSLKGASV